MSTKPSYKVMQIADLDPNKNNEAWSAKIDGAHTIIKMTEGKLPLHYSHRISKRTGEPIEYTAKLQHVKTPSKFNAVIRGETYATTKDGIAVHPDVVTATLNSGLEKSIAMQKNLGIKTQTALIDVDKFAGKDMRKASYAEKRAVLERIAESNPDYHLPDTAYDPESKAKLLKSILDKTHHQTKEGLVVHDLANPDKPFTKAKVIDHHDVYITGIFQEEGVKEGRRPMAGGFTYAWSPEGKTVGKVGTGFNHTEKVDMMNNPEHYIGRVAKVKALDVSKNKVLVKPSFDGWHVEKNLKEASEMGFEKLASVFAPYKDFLNEYHYDQDIDPESRGEAEKEMSNSVREGEGWPLIPEHIHPFMMDGAGNHYALNAKTGEVLDFDHEVHGPEENYLYHGTGKNLHEFMEKEIDDWNNYEPEDNEPYNTSAKGLFAGAGIGALAGGVGAGILAHKYIPSANITGEIAGLGILGGLIGGAKLGHKIDNAIFNWKHRTASESIDQAFEKLAGFLPPMSSAVNRTMSGLTTKRVMGAAALKPKIVQTVKPFKAMQKSASQKYLVGTKLGNISKLRKLVGKPVRGVEYNVDEIAKATKMHQK